MLHISLDVEGVLADTHRAVYEETEAVPPAPRDWSFESEEVLSEFMTVSDDLWQNRHEEIPPMDDSDTIHEVTKALIDHGHRVDIVTHRQNADEQMKAWLDSHNAVYDVFHSPTCEKNLLAYDVYIDDKPALAEAVIEDPRKVIALYARPYNNHIDVRSDRVERIVTLREVQYMLTNPTTVDAVQSLCRA